MADYGYGNDPKDPPSKFIMLKSKGEMCTIRLASLPYRDPKIWPAGRPQGGKPMTDEDVAKMNKLAWYNVMKDPKWEIGEQFEWLVIDRLDGQAKIYKGTPVVYKKIKVFAQNPAWGDPTQYDFQITRTELPGASYYDVQALPDKRALSPEEAALVSKLDVDKLIPNARPFNGPQVDDVSEDEITQLMEQQSAQKRQARAEIHQDKSDEMAAIGLDSPPPSLDDMPDFSVDDVPPEAPPGYEG